jgi:hypothetical protein
MKGALDKAFRGYFSGSERRSPVDAFIGNTCYGAVIAAPESEVFTHSFNSE